MKEVKLSRLVLRNFKGFNFDLDIGGSNVDISGRNATGKTTLADAFSWLLFDKDSQGKADFEIKNLDAQGQEEHGLEHSVEGTLSINGAQTILKKVYMEIWTKKRGSAQAVFTGHTTDYFIDGVPTQKKDYVSRVIWLAGDESIFKLLTSPSAFPTLHWQKQRALLLEICGDLTDAQVIDSDTKLAGLIEILGKHSLDDHRKVIAARRTEINKELEKIPVRIDEVRRGLPDITGLDQKAIIKEVGVLETELNDAKLRLQGLDTGGNIAELSKKLSIINADIQKIEQAYYQDAMKVVNRLNQQITEITSTQQGAERQERSVKEDIRQKQNKITSLENELVRLREKWAAINAESFTDTTEDTCPACMQPLPSERVQDAREKAQANFNRSKAEKLTKIGDEGKSVAASVKLAQEDIEELHKSLPEAANKDNELLPLITQRDAVKNMAENYESITERKTLLGNKDHLETAIKKEKEGVSVDRAATSEQIEKIHSELITVRNDADKFRQREQGEKRIEELKADEKKLAAELEKLEKELYLCESFIKTKVSMLTDKINSRFEVARFKLFNILVNGGIEECCEITVQGIPYNGGLNNGAKINAGLDVCQTLSRHYGLMAPIFIDNAESVCELTRMEAQVIRLVVSEQDKVLRVETGKTQGTLL